MNKIVVICSIKSQISQRYLAMLLIMVLSFSQTFANAQEKEYKMEIGGMLGGGFYLGDANYSAFYKNTKAAFGALYRYNMNPRMAFKGNLTYGRVVGDAKKQKNIFPDAVGQQWDFDNPVVDLSCTYEISFWGYGTGTGYKGNKRLTPYIQLGLGATVGKSCGSLNLPIGLGIKYKLAERWNVGLDWSMHFSFTDKLDGISDPYKMESGVLKNKDSYSFTMLYLSYDFCPRRRECNNVD